ncbi:MAG TPA: PKD domain-containing protein, partial [Methanolinea sp.]|nr:PKD domain-containing protein [Methanolinea sp.]
ILPLFAGFSASPVFGKAPLTVTFTDESFGNPTFYIYDFGDGFKSMDPNPAHTYRFPGRYTVSQKVLRVGHGTMQSDVEVKQDLILVSA